MVSIKLGTSPASSEVALPKQKTYFEGHPKFISQEWLFGRGLFPQLGDVLTIVINHLHVLR